MCVDVPIIQLIGHTGREFLYLVPLTYSYYAPFCSLITVAVFCG